MLYLLDKYAEFGYWKDYQHLYEISVIKLNSYNYDEDILYDLQENIIELWCYQLKKDM